MNKYLQKRNCYAANEAAIHRAHLKWSLSHSKYFSASNSEADFSCQSPFTPVKKGLTRKILRPEAQVPYSVNRINNYGHDEAVRQAMPEMELAE